MLHVALMLLCLAMLIHFSQHWFVLSTVQLKDYRAERLRSHLDWHKTSGSTGYGSTSPGSAMKSRV